MHYPKISIITPSLNQGAYIERTIQSVLSQNYPNLEYFVIDGGSSDQTRSILQKYQDEITCILSEPDQGQSHAINKGLQMATGDVINWLNSDDYYEPYALFKVANTFNNERINVVAGKRRIWQDQRSIHLSEGTDIYSDNLAKTIGWARIEQPETFFRASSIERIGLLDTRLHYLMDRDWWVKYLFTFGLSGVIKIHDLLVNFRLHRQSKSLLKQKEIQYETDTFYYGLANAFRLYEYTYLLRNHCHLDEHFRLQIGEDYTRSLVAQVLNYYVLWKALQAEQAQNHDTFRAFLDAVKPELLAREDRKLFYRLQWKEKYLPKFLAQYFFSTKKYTPKTLSQWGNS